jgi:hypothetical protein
VNVYARCPREFVNPVNTKKKNEVYYDITRKYIYKGCLNGRNPLDLPNTSAKNLILINCSIEYFT